MRYSWSVKIILPYNALSGDSRLCGGSAYGCIKFGDNMVSKTIFSTSELKIDNTIDTQLTHICQSTSTKIFSDLSSLAWGYEEHQDASPLNRTGKVSPTFLWRIEWYGYACRIQSIPAPSSQAILQKQIQSYYPTSKRWTHIRKFKEKCLRIHIVNIL